MSDATIHVVVCDDNLAVRVTLSRALMYKPNLEVLDEVGSFDQLEASLARRRPDVLLLDVNMPGVNGLEGIAKLRRRGIVTPIVAMSADRQNEDLAISAGAQSFFYKGTSDLAELADDIRRVAKVAC